MSLKSYLFILLLSCVVALPVAAATTQAIQPAQAPACALTMALSSMNAPLVQPGLPNPIELTGCSAELQCPGGTTISCTGNSYCSVWASLFFISCDGSPEYCPCYGSVCWDASDPTCVCWCMEGGGSRFECRMSCRQECPPFTP